MNKYDTETKENDYKVKVEVVDFDTKTEKEQNIFMNNRDVQGDFDNDMLRNMLKDSDVDYIMAGLSNMDMEMIGLSDDDMEIGKIGEWDETKIDDSHKKVDEETNASGENTSIDRSKNFYDDSLDNQIARHNEVEKIKGRIKSKADDDGGILSYAVLSFHSPEAKERFMVDFELDPDDKYIDGETFGNTIRLKED